MPHETNAWERFQLLKGEILRHERIAGIYLVEAAIMPADLQSATEQQAFMREFAAGFGFTQADEEWTHAEVLREEAKECLVKSLFGGPRIGHYRPDVSPVAAARLATQFLQLFGDDGRFFCYRPPSVRAEPLQPESHPLYQDFIFSAGCVASDGQMAAIFWMFDND